MAEPSRKKLPPPAGVSLRKVAGENAWEFVHPRCVHERRDDMDEVYAMLAAGEDEIAQEELRWLLEGCADFIEAHRVLGEIALAAGDLNLARAHFGYAWHIGLKAMPAKGPAGPLPYSRPANRAFHEAGKGLAHCLNELGRRDLAADVVRRLLLCDAADPLGVATLGEGMRGEPECS